MLDNLEHDITIAILAKFRRLFFIFDVSDLSSDRIGNENSEADPDSRITPGDRVERGIRHGDASGEEVLDKG